MGAPGAQSKACADLAQMLSETCIRRASVIAEGNFRPKGTIMRRLKIINLLLLILYPFAWAAPLLRAGLLPLFVQSEISLLTGLLSL